MAENGSAAKRHPTERIKMEGAVETRAERVAKLQERLKEFYAQDGLALGDLKAAPTAAEVLKAEKKQVVGKYVVARSLDFTEAQEGQFTAPAVSLDAVGMSTTGKEIPVVIKEQSRAKQKWKKYRNNIPEQFEDIEDFLAKQGFSNDHLVTERERFRDGENIARVYDIEGVDLEQYLEGGKKLDPKTAISIMVRVADGAYALHQKGVAHTDIAPLNILLKQKDAKLADLDDAVIDVSHKGKFRKQSSEIWGNRFILPPEMFKDSPEFDLSIDTYESAATLYRMVAGKWPYDAEEHTRSLPYPQRMEAYRKMHTKGEIKFPDSFPESLRLIIQKGMQPDSKKRYESMSQFIGDLMAAHKTVESDMRRQAFLERIKVKTLPQLRQSLAEREAALTRGEFQTPQEKATLEWEIARLNEVYSEQEKLEKKGIMIFRQRRLTFESPVSKTLQENKDVKLNPMREIREYFKVQDPEYLRQLDQLGSQIKQPMNKKTEVVACIPVAGPQEMSTIYNTLKSYAQQETDPETFEVLLMVNSPQRLVEGKAGDIAKTLKEIERAKKEFPKLQVRSVFTVLPDDQVKIGNIRKIGTDLALLRQQRAGIGRDLVLLSNDADNEGLAPNYVGSFAKYFKDHTEKDGAVGNLQFSANGFVRFPAIHVKAEFSTYLDQQGFKNGNVDLFGNNSAMKSSIYAAIGGYPTALRTGEQEWTGNTIRKIRKTKETLGFDEGGLLVTSIRRLLITELKNSPQQVAFGDEKAEAEMRALDVDSYPMFDYSKPQNILQLKRQLAETVNRSIRNYEKGDRLGKDAHFYRDNLEKVGIRYKVDGNPKEDESGIVITDITKFIKRQEAMQRAIKTGEKDMAKVYEASLEV